jgi:acetyl esterase/lipase
VVPETARRDYDSMATIETLRKRVRVEAFDCGGCPAEWVIPVQSTLSDLTIFYLHGGGYVIGSPRSHRVLMADLACATGARVLGVDYRLAPEHPCPAALEDALSAWHWLTKNADPTRLIMAGDSAGGGLVLALLMALRDQAQPMPAAAVTLSPWADLHGPFVQSEPKYDYLTGPNLEVFARSYAGELPRNDPRVSPVFGDFTGLPPLYITAGGQETILPGIQDVARQAKEAGVDVTFVVEEDEVHVYTAFYDVSETARRALRDIDQWIHQQL